MKSSPHFSSDHNFLSTALGTTLNRVTAYRNLNALDAGSSISVNLRFNALQIISKQDLRQHSWRGYAPDEGKGDNILRV